MTLSKKFLFLVLGVQLQSCVAALDPRSLSWSRALHVASRQVSGIPSQCQTSCSAASDLVNAVPGFSLSDYFLLIYYLQRIVLRLNVARLASKTTMCHALNVLGVRRTSQIILNFKRSWIVRSLYYRSLHQKLTTAQSWSFCARLME